MDLFEQDGYAATTAAAIAERAGVTERTFFRHFADKRDVLFGEQDRLQEVLLASAKGPTPLAAAVAGLSAVARELEPHRARQRRRAALIGGTPELVERERTKGAEWADALTRQLREQDIEETRARLAAGVAVVAFGIAHELWLRGSGDLAAHITGVIGLLSDVDGAGTPAVSVPLS